jgi:outer membrane protein assembly factor BamB
MRHSATKLDPALLALLACVLAAVPIVLPRMVGVFHVGGSGGGTEVAHRAGWHEAAPTGLLQAASNATGEANRRFWPRWSGTALRARAGRAPATFDSSGVSFASGTLRIGAIGLGDAGHVAWQRHTAPVAARNTVSYDYPLLSESFRLGSRGAEQTFEVSRAPADSHGSLQITMRLEGRARAEIKGGTVRFGTGRDALNYSDLSVRDARGRALPASLLLKAGRLVINVRTSGARFPLRVDPYITQAEIPGLGRQSFGGQSRGVALSADGNTALIGESEEAGEAYVFVRDGSSWSLQARLTQPHGPTRGFGTSVALSADGNTALVGEWEGGGWVFTRSGTKWTLQTEKRLKQEGHEATSRYLAGVVALSSDGSTAIVGGLGSNHPGEFGDEEYGAAYLFHRNGSKWSAEAMLAPSGGERYYDGQGEQPETVALSGDGNTAVLGNEAQGERGGAWIFERGSSGWQQQGGELTAPGEAGPGGFGSAVAVSGDGNTALISADYDAYGGGGAWAFVRGGGGWTPQGSELIPTDEPQSGGFGESVALSTDGSTALIGGAYNGTEDEGAAWVFRRTGSRWWQEQKISDPSPRHAAHMGASVALSADATTALVSAPGQTTSGAAYTFTGPAAPGPEPPSPPTYVPPSSPQWSALGGDPQRTATVISASLHPPFTARWSHVFPLPAGAGPRKGWEGGEEVEIPAQEVVGYPLLGNGLVYIVRANIGEGQECELDAFSQSTGELVWSRIDTGGGSFAHIALDGKRLFVDGMEEKILALDARTGGELWSRWTDSDDPLVADDGVLYYVSAFIGAETIAVNETDGRELWNGQMFDSVGSGPVIGDGDAYVMGAIGENDSTHEKGPSGWAFDESTGERAWEDSAEGAGDRPSSWTTTLTEGHLFSAGNAGNGLEYTEGSIVNPATGASEGTFPASALNSPIVDGTSVISPVPEHYDCPGLYYECKLLAATLTSYDYAHGRTLWSFNGDGRLDSGVIRVNEDVLVGSASGNLYAVDATTGQEVWSAKMPDGFHSEHGDGIGTPTGMAAGGSVIAVAAGDSLTLLTSGGPPEETASSPEAPPAEPPPASGATVSGLGAQSDASTSEPAGGAAGYKHAAVGRCLIEHIRPGRLLRAAQRRITIQVRCSASGRLTLALRYTRRVAQSRPETPVTIAATTTHVSPGTSTISLLLSTAETRLLAHHRKAAWTVTLLRR